MPKRSDRYVPFTGFLFVILVLIGVFSSKSTPGSSASGAHVIAFYTAHRSSQQTSDFLIVFGAVFFLFFIGSLFGLLRWAPAASTLAAVGLGGAFLFVVGLALFGVFDFSLADVPSKLTPAAAQALNVLANDSIFPIIIGGLVFAVPMGLAIARSGLLPAWLGWALIVIGLVLSSPGFVVGALGLMVWTVVVSIVMYRRSRPPVAQAAGPRPGLT